MEKLVSLVPVVTRIILKYSWVPLSSCPPLSWYLCCLATRPSYLCRRITFNISWKPFLVVLFLKKQTHTKHKLWNICFPHMHFKLHHFFFFFSYKTTRENSLCNLQISSVSFTSIPCSQAKYRNLKKQNTSECQGILWLTASFAAWNWFPPQNPLRLSHGHQWADPGWRLGCSFASWNQGE